MARFTDGEMDVMRILWEHGALKPAEIQQEFPRKIKNPALRSYLTTLVRKGAVTRKLQGKAYYYRTKTKRSAAIRTSVERIAKTFFGSSPEAFLCHLIKTENFSEKELIDLRRLAHSGEDDIDA